jgi:hypothetical protein
MIRVLAYVTIAVVLGLALVLIPTWLFLAKTYESSSSYAGKISTSRIPILDYQEEDRGEPFVPQWLGITGASLVVASVIYVFLKHVTLNTPAK